MQGPRPRSRSWSREGGKKTKDFPEAFDLRRYGGSRDRSEVPTSAILVSLFVDAQDSTSPPPQGGISSTGHWKAGSEDSEDPLAWSKQKHEQEMGSVARCWFGENIVLNSYDSCSSYVKYRRGEL